MEDAEVPSRFQGVDKEFEATRFEREILSSVYQRLLDASQGSGEAVARRHARKQVSEAARQHTAMTTGG